MRSSLLLYIALCVAGAAALMTHSFASSVISLQPVDVWGVCALAALGLLAEALAIEVKVGPRRVVHSSIVFVPLLASVVLFPPPVAICIAAVIQTTSQFLIHKNQWWRSTFNVAQIIIVLYVCTAAYRTLGGIPSTHPSINLLAFAGTTLAFFAGNWIVVSGAISIHHRRNYFESLQGAMTAAGGFIYDLLASPIALVISVLYAEFHIFGLLLIVLPLLLIRHSYLSTLQLERANHDLLRVLIKAIETRDPYTSGHSVRVASLARAIGEDLGHRGKALETIETAALLHDIGKIDVLYATIISKPGDLTPDERRTIQGHAAKGAELLKTLSLVDEQIIRSVRHHHEKFDGTGYPDGLSGTEIPLPARIIMMCDSIDAMLSDRPYRRALTIRQVRSELTRCAGSQFDPAIVDVVLRRNTLERASELAGRPVSEPHIYAVS